MEKKQKNNKKAIKLEEKLGTKVVDTENSKPNKKVKKQ
jgi:hypothetical protein